MTVKGELLEIDFLYLDLDSCSRCQGTHEVLEQGLAEIAPQIEDLGYVVKLNRVHVISQQQALDHGFMVSPTIRVNGHDIQLEYKESVCESCTEHCGCTGNVSCREWLFEGQWYSVPPKALVRDAILSTIRNGAPKPKIVKTTKLPKNLKDYFHGVAATQESGECCTPEKTCCENNSTSACC